MLLQKDLQETRSFYREYVSWVQLGLADTKVQAVSESACLALTIIMIDYGRFGKSAQWLLRQRKLTEF